MKRITPKDWKLCRDKSGKLIVDGEWKWYLDAKSEESWNLYIYDVKDNDELIKIGIAKDARQRKERYYGRCRKIWELKRWEAILAEELFKHTTYHLHSTKLPKYNVGNIQKDSLLPSIIKLGDKYRESKGITEVRQMSAEEAIEIAQEIIIDIKEKITIDNLILKYGIKTWQGGESISTSNQMRTVIEVPHITIQLNQLNKSNKEKAESIKIEREPKTKTMESQAQKDGLREKLEEQRKRLLDLGGRSKLINYKHSTTSTRSKKQSFLRIVDEIPELIIEKLDKEGSFQLVAKPEDDEYEVDLKLLAEAGKLSTQHSDNKIQVIEEEPVFSLSCEKLRTENRLSLQEKGINTLNIAIGFLHWYESKGIRSKEERYSPLLLLPVQISRSKSRTGYQYSIDGSEDDIALNTSLWLKLKTEEGLELPEFELDDDGQPMLSDFFASIKEILGEKNTEDKGEDRS